MKDLTRRDLERRKAFNLVIATMFPGDDSKPLRRALRKCRSPEDVQAVPGISIEKAEEFSRTVWPHTVSPD